MSSQIKVGIVGVGIGKAHISAYSKLPDVKIAAVCDLNIERAKSVADEFSVPHVFTDYNEMLHKVETDAISVCTPNAFHADVAIASLKAGKHVLCEKPMANTLVAAESIAQEASKAKANGQIFMIAMNNRFRGDTQVLKKFITNGELGDIYYAKCGWTRRNGIPGFGGWFTTKQLSGGGPLIDIGVHVLDLTVYLMGNPTPISASGSAFAKFGPRGRGQGGWGYSNPGETKYDVEDLAAGMVKFDNGATLMLEASWASYTKEDSFYSTILGTEGGADLEPLAVYKDIAGIPVDIEPAAPKINGHEEEIVHFISCIKNRTEPLSTAEQGLHILQILDAIYRSADSGREVLIDQVK